MLAALEADEKRNASENSEAAVDKTPGEGDASDGTGDQGERNHRDAGDQAELEDPLVTDGVSQRTDEGNGEDKVGEAQPVGSVGEEWVSDAVVEECCVNLVKPEEKATGQCGISVNKVSQPAGFPFECEGGEAAEDQSRNENGKPSANGVEQLSFGSRLLRF